MDKRWSSTLNNLKALIIETYGHRCSEFQLACLNCQVWRAFDDIHDNAPEESEE